eukprot:TRINITY_DN1109_c0_g2_i1.p1 TRINITY_DN1109_c0_g2~~TRINITY_DN1109_c0_g2_i1.p1  ORF type:complete len:151 (-),score=38.20 TRINITY_DN1109_c0_g2_i1:62-514(-)
MEKEDYGGVTENYKWTQTENDVTINVPFPKETKGKEIDFVLKPKYLKVGIHGQKPKIDGELHQFVLVDDSIWSLSEGDLEINLKKASSSAKWWKCVVEGDPETDVSFIEGSKYLDDSLIRRIKNEKRQKAEEERKREQEKHESPASSEHP